MLQIDSGESVARPKVDHTVDKPDMCHGGFMTRSSAIVEIACVDKVAVIWRIS